jgi:hypothetical protein
MSYVLEDDSHIVSDVLRRKEFYQYNLPKKEVVDIIPRFMLNKLISEGSYLQFHSYQLFVSNLMNPNTPYSRLLMKWQTGTGKTIGALSLALNFIKYFQKEEAQGITAVGSVFIIGFTSHVFKNELLRFPELGIISRQELIKLNKLKKLAYSGTTFDAENLQEFLTKIKKRFNNRKNNGFFQFIGYKKLVNMVFKVAEPDMNISFMTEEEIKQAVSDEKITVNTELLNEFKNSLVICDEIHNVYNSLTTNNWGIALRYVLDYDPSIRAVFMSATPINNNPTEVVDLLNLILPRSHYKLLSKADFFDTNKQLKRGALDKIAELCRGRVSYLRDVNPKYFPSKKFIGTAIPDIPYLKFVRSPMSEFHYATYKQLQGSLTPESQYLTDFALPNPNNAKVGLYQTSEVKKYLPYASQKWKDANKINYQKDLIVGDILQEKNLGNISTKYATMINVIIQNIKNDCGKTFIYHNVIHMSGVLFIQEILRQNFIIGEYDGSTANTLCAICGQHRKEHSESQLNTVGVAIEPIPSSGPSKKGGGQQSTTYNPSTKIHKVFAPNNTLLLEFTIVDDMVIIPSQNINTSYKPMAHIVNSVRSILKLNPRFKSAIIRNTLRKGDLPLMQLLAQLNYIEVGKIYPDKMKKLQYYSTKKFWQDNEVKDINSAIKKIEKVISKPRRARKLKSPIKGGKSNPLKKSNHVFTPVRFITAHSELDRVRMNKSLEKFNSPDNSDGNRVMILIGGKLMQEAHDIKAVREMMIMGRPDNIPILIQILGRAVRKNSHKYLPEDKRNVNVRIFTSCSPVKDSKTKTYKLGYEEEKYMIKLKQYKVIQEIEKTFHENAIDAFINRDIIWSPEERIAHRRHKGNKNNNADLGALYFEPNLPKSYSSNRTFKLNELNLQTFDTFHTNTEIDNIMIIIKRLFIERSPVWTYADLLTGTRRSREFMQVEFNTELISEDLFIVALSRLVWAMDPQYIEPMITTTNRHGVPSNNIQSKLHTIIDKLFDTEDKIIILPGGQKSVITQVGTYYMMFPMDEINNEPIKIVELPYRINKSKEDATIDIKRFLESGQSLVDYSDKRTRFFNKWNNVAIEKLEMAVCDFGTDFHMLFLEECVKYVFDVWTDPKMKKSFMHAFYFKMLNYYDLRQLVIWGHTLKPYVFRKYKDLLTPVSVKLSAKRVTEAQKATVDKSSEATNLESSGLINMLKSSINKSALNWVSSGLKSQFETTLDNSLALFDGNYKKPGKSKAQKVKADLVPVGHFLRNMPKFYHPTTGWVEDPEYLNSDDIFIENQTIVGYDERSKTGVHIRFKIRNPIQNIKQFKDSRLIEKGSVCSSKNKIYLKEIAKKIGVKLRPKFNVAVLCNDIRTRLIYLELKERLAKSKKKYFYFIYEQRPETIDQNV